MRDDRGVIPDATSSHDRRHDELAFLHEIAQLATLARDWDELMHSIVDGTTAAMGVEVCSFYLADGDRTRLTLAATNGLDRSQVGKVSLAWGQGITGRVAASRTPIAVGLDGEVEQAVMGQRADEVVVEPDPGRDRGVAGTVEAERDRDVRFARRAGDGHPTTLARSDGQVAERGGHAGISFASAVAAAMRRSFSSGSRTVSLR